MAFNRYKQLTVQILSNKVVLSYNRFLSTTFYACSLLLALAVFNVHVNFVISTLLGDANRDLSFDVLSTNILNDSCKDTHTIEYDNHDTASIQSNACLNITF